MKPPPLQDMASVAVIGGGCAGLSLARRLVDTFPGLTVVIFEPRHALDHDRTWCYWGFEPTPYDALATHAWTSFLIRSSSGETVVACESTPYHRLPSGRFYESQIAALESHPRIELRLGTTVDDLVERDAGVRVSWTDGAGPSHADFTMAFDSRPPIDMRTNGAFPTLVQHFVGHEVVFDDDRFDPDRPTLMDFDVSQRDGLHFMYVLPFSPRRGLIESTFMTPPSADVPDYDRHIREYVNRRFDGAPMQITRTERGRLPMHAGRIAPAPTARVWPIGTRAGVARPSTGYAFDAIQRDTARVVAALQRGGVRPRPPRAPLMDLLDRTLLTLLADRPTCGPDLFATLFRDAPGPALLRFLSDRASGRDTLAVIRAMPAGLISKHVLTAPHRCVR